MTQPPSELVEAIAKWIAEAEDDWADDELMWGEHLPTAEFVASRLSPHVFPSTLDEVRDEHTTVHREYDRSGSLTRLNTYVRPGFGSTTEEEKL